MSNGVRPQRQYGLESSDPAGVGNSTARRVREDYELAQMKLTDQQFSMKRYPDPLVTRPASDPQFFPDGVTLEMEKKWLATIKGFNEDSSRG